MRSIIPQLLLALLPLAPLAAQGWIDERPVGPGPVRSSPAIERVGSTVRVTIGGRIARFEVEERFRNTGRGIAEGTYHYPMPGEALFTDFSLFQGEKELKGEMMPADQARGMDKMTVAEFVEDAASMSILFSCGMNFVQGNFLQEPEQVMTYDFGGS